MKRAVKQVKVGTKVEIRNGLLKGQWGVVKLIDEASDEYHVAPWNGGECVVLSRDEISVMAGTKIAPTSKSSKVGSQRSSSSNPSGPDSYIAAKLRLVRSYSSISDVKVEGNDIVFKFSGKKYSISKDSSLTTIAQTLCDLTGE